MPAPPAPARATHDRVVTLWNLSAHPTDQGSIRMAYERVVRPQYASSQVQALVQEGDGVVAPALAFPSHGKVMHGLEACRDDLGRERLAAVPRP